MSVRYSLAITAALLLLAACATSEPEPTPVARQSAGEDPRIAGLLDGAWAELNTQRGSVPAGLDISVADLRESGGQLLFEASFAVPSSRGREAEAFTVYVSCGQADLAACSRKLADAARALKRARR